MVPEKLARGSDSTFRAQSPQIPLEMGDASRPMGPVEIVIALIVAAALIRFVSSLARGPKQLPAPVRDAEDVEDGVDDDQPDDEPEDDGDDDEAEDEEVEDVPSAPEPPSEVIRAPEIEVDGVLPPLAALNALEPSPPLSPLPVQSPLAPLPPVAVQTQRRGGKPKWE
ncbi:MAG: hypothetical protein JST54_21175 [Deltaproteobacteria bacterium]|nr:hypothetical protein [Deltaproteobacteria bacterium]